MITTIHIHALLLLATAHHPSNHAILRLQKHDQTVGGIGLAYLPRRVYCVGQEKGVIPFSLLHPHLSLDLTEPGTSQALLIALALALGLDPGPLGLQCSWVPWGDLRVHTETLNGVEHRSPPPVWALDCAGESVMFGDIGRWPGRVLPVPALIKGETDYVKALVAAAVYVLEHP